MLRRTALLGLASSAVVGAQPVCAGDAKDDVDILGQAFEALHPGLLRYQTTEQIRANLRKLKDQLTSASSLETQYLDLSRFAASVRCGHTYANFFNQSKSVASKLFERDDCLPFQFRWVQSRMIVTRNLSKEEALQPGVEVIALNGVPARAVLSELMPLGRADGGNDAKRVAWLEIQGNEAVEAFDVFWPLCFPNERRPIQLELRTHAESSAHEVLVQPISSADRRGSRHTNAAGTPWSLEFDDDAVALLSMPTWALYNSSWDWKTWLAEAFEKLAAMGAPGLVIDLRANEGGLDVGDVLLAHLARQPLHLPAPRRLVRYRRVPDDLRPYLDTWDPSFFDWGDAVTPFDERFFRFVADSPDGMASIVPRSPRFKGRVAALVGPTNSSATFEFAARLRSTGLGVLVGETTGGNQRGINGGAFFFLKLPRTGLEIDLPLIGQFPVGPLVEDGGLRPDVFVESTVADIATGHDAALAAAKAVLRRA